MATILQKRAIENIASGKYKTYKDAMIEAGYSSQTAKHPGAKLVDSKAVNSIVKHEEQDLRGKLHGVLETALENCRSAIQEGDRDAIDAWKSEFSAKFLKLFEKQTELMIQQEGESEALIDHEQLEKLVIDYLANSAAEKRDRIFKTVADQIQA